MVNKSLYFSFFEAQICHTGICTLAPLSKGPLLPRQLDGKTAQLPTPKISWSLFKIWQGSTVFHVPIPLPTWQQARLECHGAVKYVGCLAHLWCCPRTQHDNAPGELYKYVRFYWSRVQLGYLQLLRWFYYTARIENLCPLAPCHFLLAGALSKVVSHQALHLHVCQSQPQARGNGCSNNPVEGCCSLGQYQKPNHTVNCTGGKHIFVFHLKLCCPIATMGI